MINFILHEDKNEFLNNFTNKNTTIIECAEKNSKEINIKNEGIN
jgi:hypothetical protein